MMKVIRASIAGGEYGICKFNKLDDELAKAMEGIKTKQSSKILFINFSL